MDPLFIDKSVEQTQAWNRPPIPTSMGLQGQRQKMSAAAADNESGAKRYTQKSILSMTQLCYNQTQTYKL